MVDAFIFCYGLWITAGELLAEYCNLVNHPRKYFRLIMIAPAICLFISTHSEKKSRLLYPHQMLELGIAGSAILPIAAIIFMTKTQSVPLMIHLTTGVLAVTVAYVTRLISFLNEQARHSLFCEMLGLSTVLAYSMFQTVFQVGEKLSDNGPMIMRTPMRRNQLDNFLHDTDPLLNPVEF